VGQQWNESTAEIGPPTDTQGNIYQSALGPTELEGPVPLSQAIYYAKNIAPAAAGTNVVTIRFNGAAVYPDLRILEYSGVDPFDPVDAAGSGIGNGATSTSATVLTNNDADLLVGASIASTPSTGPGSGFTQRLLSLPNGAIVQDRTVTAAGPYNASAPLSAPGRSIMQIVAFRAANLSTTAPAFTP
jgi:hypothetical protein